MINIGSLVYFTMDEEKIGVIINTLPPNIYEGRRYEVLWQTGMQKGPFLVEAIYLKELEKSDR